MRGIVMSRSSDNKTEFFEMEFFVDSKRQEAPAAEAVEKPHLLRFSNSQPLIHDR